MNTDWVAGVNAIATNLAKGNALAGLIGYSPKDNLAFTLGHKLRPIGSSSTEPTAWYISSPLKQTGLDYCNEFTASGPYPLLGGLGLTPEQVEDYKLAVFLECGDRASCEAHGLQFIREHGYELIPLLEVE